MIPVRLILYIVGYINFNLSRFVHFAKLSQNKKMLVVTKV